MITWTVYDEDTDEEIEVTPNDKYKGENILSINIDDKEFSLYRNENDFVILEKYLNKLKINDLPKEVDITPVNAAWKNGIEYPIDLTLYRDDEGLFCTITHSIKSPFNDDYESDYEDDYDYDKELSLIKKFESKIKKYNCIELEEVDLEEEYSPVISGTILFRNPNIYLYKILAQLKLEFNSNNWFYESEEDFTKHTVIPALKMRGYFNIEYSHGNQEYGKDIIYSFKDSWGHIKYGAAQVKLGNISGRAQSNLSTILNQCQMAFDIPFKLLNTSGEQYISELLIICSGKFTYNAKNIINNRRFHGSIIFIDGDELTKNTII